MNVLSLFDGMSCGQLALNRIGLKYDNYFASEIDKYAISVTMANFPNTIQLGSVVDLDTSKLPKIDLLIGGSPCQSFSFAGRRKGMTTKDSVEILTLEHYLQLKSEKYEFEGQSYLFWEYMRILKEVKPKYFLLENVKMAEKWSKILSNAIGVKPILINSSLVSAQNRERLYWTNIGLEPKGLFDDMESVIEQPKDKQLILKDILQDNPNAKYYVSDKVMAWINREHHTFKLDIRTEDQKGKTVIVGGKGNTDLVKVEVVGLKEVRSEEAKEIRRQNQKNGIDSNPYRKKDLVERNDGKTGAILTSLTNDNLIKETIPIDEKYYLSNNMTKNMQVDLEKESKIIGHSGSGGQKGFVYNTNHKMGSLLASDHKQPKQIISKETIPIQDKYYINLNDSQKEKFDKLNVKVDKSGTLTEAIGRGGSSYEYLSMLKRNSIITHNITQNVKVRKIDVDIPNLQKLLKKHKKKEMTLDAIAKSLDVPKTMVEHWFRKDSGFAIPNPEVWLKLKEILNIETDEFDSSIMEFEEREGNYDKANRVYDEEGKSPTLTIQSNNDKIFAKGDANYRIRRLTPIECERLQTVPDNYTNHVSDTQRYRMLGNGWTIDVIAHIFSYIKK